MNNEIHSRFKDIVDLKTMMDYLERYDPKQTFTVDIEERNRVVDYKDIVDLETMRGYLERYDPKQTFTVDQLITMINAAIYRKKYKNIQKDEQIKEEK